MKILTMLTGLLLGGSSLLYGQAEPPYGMNEREAYSVFLTSYQTQDYEMALMYGQWILESKPRQLEGYNAFSLVTQFERMINVYERLADNEPNPSLKAEQLEKALEIFDLTLETFTEEEVNRFEWTHKRGLFYQNHRDVFTDGLQMAFAEYEKAYEMDPQRFTELSDGYYTRILLQNYAANGEREKVLAMIEEVESYAPPELIQAIEQTRNELYSNPEERVVWLESQLAEAENVEEEEELLSELAELYEDLGDTEKSVNTVHRLYELNPTYENTRILADLSLENAEYEQALDYLEEALEKSPTEDIRKRVTLEISDTYNNMENLQSARTYARQAISIDGNWGQPYLRMASIYQSAVSRCTVGAGRTMARDDRTVYWLVLDYLEAAARVDSSVRATANQRIEQIRAVMPNGDDLFFRSWEAGTEFSIDGSIGECYSWIGETTTVRSP